MLFECATITSISSTHLTLQSARGSACERCARGKGCGGGVIGKLVFRRQPVLELDLPGLADYAVGQRVELSVPAQRVMKLAALVYLIPLAGVLIGALCGHWLLGSDAAAIVTSIAGFVASIWVLRKTVNNTLSHWLIPSIAMSGSKDE